MFTRRSRHCCGHRANLLPLPPYFMHLSRNHRDYRSRMDLDAARGDIVKPADSAILYSSTRFFHACTRSRVEITSREGSSGQNKVRSCVYSSPTSVADEIRTVFHSTQAEGKQTKLTNARSKHAKLFRNGALYQTNGPDVIF